MDNQINEIPQPAKKQKKSIWLWILLGLLGLVCLCLAVAAVVIINNPLLLNIFDTGSADTDIKVGTYDGTIYTAPNNIFSCDFKDIMQDGLNPILHADENTAKNGDGFVAASNDFGNQYGVHYFNILNWGGKDMAEALLASNTREEALQNTLEQTVLFWFPNAIVTHQEFLPNAILFVVIDNPGVSNLEVTQNGVTTPADSQEGYYIFSEKEWIYVLYHSIVPLEESLKFDPDVMQNQVDSFYQGCQFQR
ncbi:MAG: hypothetical protein KA138_10580 [Saprospiraceae bacterium]|nr:hypothetical protein [Saprospiraceae bacterium]